MSELPPSVVRLDLPATHAAVRIARHVTNHFTRLHGVPDAERDTLALVASELLANCVDHGGGGQAMDASELMNGATMKLELAVTGGSWRLVVSDEGGGDAGKFQTMLDDAGFPNLEDDRGRGLFLMKESVDRLTVDPSDDGLGLKVTAVRDYGGG